MLVAQSGLPLCDPVDCEPARFLCPWDFPGKSTGVGSHFPLQGIFRTQGLNLSLLHYRRILYHLSQSSTSSERDTSATKASAISDCGKEGPVSLWPAQIPSNLSAVVWGWTLSKIHGLWRVEKLSHGESMEELGRWKQAGWKNREREKHHPGNHSQQDKLECLEVTHRQVSGKTEMTVKQCS